jgi:hypothetical protein
MVKPTEITLASLCELDDGKSDFSVAKEFHPKGTQYMQISREHGA